MINWIKHDLAAGNVVLGAGVTLSSPLTAEMLAAAGSDFLFLDLEHGAINLETAHLMVAVVQGKRTLCFARVPSQEPWHLKQALDMGVHGVIVPFVNCAAEAERVVRACRYPPNGIRGLSCQFAAARWGVTVPEYVEIADREIMVIVQVETTESVDLIDEIVAVPGIDMIFVGPADLSATCGFPLNVAHPEVEKRIARVAEATRSAEVALGTVARTPKEVRHRVDQGFGFFVVAADTGLLIQGGKDKFARIREGLPAYQKAAAGVGSNQ
jgi:4-hydroxy-2-oxoheptanedioate aldolase